MSEDVGRTRAALRRAYDWTFRSRETGEITIVQSPNLAFATYFCSVLARYFVTPSGTAGTILGIVAGASLAWWSLDELLRGVNPWRRLLGAVVLAYGIAMLVAREQ